MKFLIVDCGSAKTPKIAAALAHLGEKFDLTYKEDLHLQNKKSYAGIIISGAPILLTELVQKPYLKMFAYLKKDAPTPTLGICFGHQIIGLWHGATIYRHEEITGRGIIFIKKGNEIFENMGAEPTFEQDHKESLHLSKEFELLAGSEKTAVEAMKHTTKPLWGVQFHPEASGEVGQQLLKNFCDLCKRAFQDV